MNPSTLVPVATTLIAAAGAWLVARRKGSGRVATTEADRLWAASEQVRTDLMALLTARDARIASLEARVAELEARRD